MIYYKTRKAFESPIYRRSRLAARLILKARAGRKLKDSDKALAARLAGDPAVTSRLIDQAIQGLCRPADLTSNRSVEHAVRNSAAGLGSECPGKSVL
jgi:hypothetical protein